jgi:hypothetical protein
LEKTKAAFHQRVRKSLNFVLGLAPALLANIKLALPGNNVLAYLAYLFIGDKEKG